MINSLLGNPEIKETLKSIVSSGRFPHAFIIEGEEGSGRHTLARIIAAEHVALVKKLNRKIRLIAVIPFEGQDKKWNAVGIA